MVSGAGTAETSAIRRPVFEARRLNTAARVSIGVHEPSARISLRLRALHAAAASIARPASVLLPMPINSCRLLNLRTVVRLGPDEWLVLCPEREAEQTTSEFAVALRGFSLSLTDISHRNVGLAVSGVCAREVLNSGCPLDLSDARFPSGSATRTIFGKAEIVLLRPTAELVYRVECWRSLAPYVHGLLRHGAREFGIE